MSMVEMRVIDTVKVVMETDDKRFEEKVLEIVEVLQTIHHLEVEIQYNTVVTNQSFIKYVAYITGYDKKIIM